MSDKADSLNSEVNRIPWTAILIRRNSFEYNVEPGTNHWAMNTYWSPWQYKTTLVEISLFIIKWGYPISLPALLLFYTEILMGFPDGSEVKNPPANEGDLGLIPGLGRSLGEGSSNSLQYSCLGNLMDRIWQAPFHGVAEESDVALWLNNNNTEILIQWKPLVAS